MCLRLLLAEDCVGHTIDARRDVAGRKFEGIDDLVGFERRRGFGARRRDSVRPRQRQTHNRRVDLILDLRGDVGFDGRLIHAVLITPVENLLLGQFVVRSERASRRSERAGAVAGAGVGLRVVSGAGFLGAVAPPVGGDDDIGEGAFGRLNEKAFDDPRDGGHRIRRWR